MNLACKDVTNLMEAAKQLVAYEKILSKWLNGKANEDVSYNGITIPTLRKLIATIDERESRAAEEVINEGLAQITLIKNRMNDLADKVQANIDKLVDMQVDIEMLAEGATATGTYDNDTGMLTLQIPRGYTGKDGAAGPMGQAPVIDVINCGKAQTSWLTVLDGGHANTYEVANA